MHNFILKQPSNILDNLGVRIKKKRWETRFNKKKHKTFVIKHGTEAFFLLFFFSQKRSLIASTEHVSTEGFKFQKHQQFMGHEKSNQKQIVGKKTSLGIKRSY